jgi:hypothetical protein
MSMSTDTSNYPAVEPWLGNRRREATRWSGPRPSQELRVGVKPWSGLLMLR